VRLAVLRAGYWAVRLVSCWGGCGPLLVRGRLLPSPGVAAVSPPRAPAVPGALGQFHHNQGALDCLSGGDL